MKTTSPRLWAIALFIAIHGFFNICFAAGENVTTDQDWQFNDASISGKVWFDNTSNINHVLNPEIDQALANIEVILLNDDAIQVDVNLTDTSGYYVFDSLAPGSYQVMFIAPSNLSFVHPNVGDDESLDSDVVDLINGKTEIFFVDIYERRVNVDAGLRFKTLAIESIKLDGAWDYTLNIARLHWTVQQSTDTRLITVFRSSDQDDQMTEIDAFVPQAKGAVATSFTFDDKDIPRAGQYYYQVGALDSDGQQIKSNVLAIDVDELDLQTADLITYPNPVSDELVAIVTLPDESLVSFRLINIQGKMVHLWRAQHLPQGRNTLVLEVPEVPAAQYILEATIKDQIVRQVLVVQ